MIPILPSDYSTHKYGLSLRLVNEDDAGFILSLRNNPLKSRFINDTSPHLEDQVSWIKDYKVRESLGTDYYFIYEFCGRKAGVNRIYNINGTSFIHGSWLFSDDVPPFCPLAAAIMAREIAFNVLSLTEENDVAGIHEKNIGVLQFATFMGEKFIGERIDPKKGRYITGILTKQDFYDNHDKIINLFPKRYNK